MASQPVSHQPSAIFAYLLRDPHHLNQFPHGVNADDVRAAQDRTRNYRAVVHLSDKRFVPLATPDLPTVNPGADPVRTLGTSDLPYQKEMSWDTTYNDVYVVNLKDGMRKKVLEHHNGANSISPGGNYLIYFDEPSGHWFTYQVANGTRVNLTELRERVRASEGPTRVAALGSDFCLRTERRRRGG